MTSGTSLLAAGVDGRARANDRGVDQGLSARAAGYGNGSPGGWSNALANAATQRSMRA